jgi:hypothetical protein
MGKAHEAFEHVTHSKVPGKVSRFLTLHVFAVGYRLQ